MDVSSPPAKSTLPIHRAIRGVSETQQVRCHLCGYLRTGLPPGARCPECGEAAPVEIEPAIGAAGAARDRSEQAWLAAVGAGLVLLVVSSFYAIQVELVMPLGGLVLSAVNAPGPKVCAAALIQRSIGQPGPWGVLGTLAVLGNVLAVWLITEPRTALAGGEDPWSLRRLTRWTCVITTGAMLGYQLSGVEHSYSWGWSALPSLAAAVALVEMPANALLYLYLARIAERVTPASMVATRMGQMSLLRTAAVLVPAVCAVGAGMAVIRGMTQDKPVVAWRVVQSVYGAVALPVGMIMTAGVLRLGAGVLGAIADRSVVSLAGKLARLRASVGRLAGAVRADPLRWAAVLGIAIWLWNTRPLLTMTGLIEHRRGLGGDLPALNFIGPKVWAVPILDRGEYYYNIHGQRHAIVMTVIAVWLITTPLARRTSRALRHATRWLPTVLIGAVLGLALTIQRAAVRDSVWAAGMMIGVEAPATLVLYLYLSRLARALGETRLGRQLWFGGFAAAALILSPVWFYLLSRPLRGYHNHPLAAVAGAGYGAVVVCVGVLAWALIVRLTWLLATAPPGRLTSAGDDDDP